MTITEFLLARITEDEREAIVRLAQYREGGSGYTHENPQVRRWDRVLAECQAKRLLVEDVQPRHPDYDPDFVKKAIASVYADHPDYDPSWRP